jgi:hypothetical protein
MQAMIAVESDKLNIAVLTSSHLDINNPAVTDIS